MPPTRLLLRACRLQGAGYLCSSSKEERVPIGFGAMIKYALQCERDHGFEAWFRNSDAFEAQAAKGDLVCPFCGSDRVRKAVMAPRIAAGRAPAPAEDATGLSETAVAETATGGSQKTLGTAGRNDAVLRQKLLELRDVVEASCSYVGSDFAEEARKIHYGEADARGIYGETSQDEAQALTEEGIAVARLPWISRGDA